METIWLLFPVLLWLLHSFMVCLGTTPLANLTMEDQSVLLTLKAHITSDPNKILADNWSTATSCCNWIGVTCGRRHQRVTVLNLANMNLTGTIPPHLGNLSFLASLNINNNWFHGHLPDQLAFLRRLKVVHFGNNNFDGQIPSWFGLLPQLQSLNLSINSFSGSIPSSIYNMALLQNLDFGYNSLSGSLPVDMCSHLPKLEILHLFHNKLHGQIPSTLHKCRRLQKLALSLNKFTGSIPKEIANITMLQDLYLGYNNLEGEIPQELGNCVGLNILSIPASNLIGTIPKFIGNLTAMKELFLGYNNFRGAIPHELGNLLNLEKISLHFNGLSGFIPSNIFNISTLKLITLNSNNLSGQLPPSIGLDLPNLKELYLWGNKLSGIIPSSISNASKLTNLELSTNLFTGSIPNTLGNLRLLDFLNFEENYLITETSKPESRFLTSLTNCRYLRVLSISGIQWNDILPISVGNLSASLESFYAEGCNIKGHIPREIGNLSNLILLELGSNDLTGSLPPTIGGLQNLQGLGLSKNNLQGFIPYDLCLLRRLVNLRLDGNELSGPIPTCIGNHTFLQQFRLNSNKLSSIIPSALTRLTGILILDLSSNSLSGNLPLEIGSLKVVTRIDISMNHLTGNIPSTTGSLQSLVNLSLAHNRLQGPIPSSFGDLVSLGLLDLSHNNLSGGIPKSLEKLRYLKLLNVSSNRLQGEIPNGGPFAKFSAQSFMLNDALCGAPQFKVSPCKIATPRRSWMTVVRVLKYALPAMVIIIVTVLLFLLIRCRKRNKIILAQSDLLSPDWRRISYQEISQVTDGFSTSNLLGNGSFGSVYKGILSDGMIVAIKVFNLQLEGAFKSFDTECEILHNIRHRNLIKIISSCSNNLDFKALVLEYMPNGSLEKWLYSHNYFLDILQRLNIMIDVALALEYLHHDYSAPIVHCDIKPSNILLDGDMVAHVGDFGIAKLLGDGEFMKQTMTLATFGYMAPEYGIGGIVSSRGDVYSYGIMLIETFTRKKPTDESFTEEMSFKRWVSDSLHGSITKVVDSNLLGREDEPFAEKEQCVSSILGLAVACTADLPEERITMKDVVLRLVKIKNKFLAHIGKVDKSRLLSV